LATSDTRLGPDIVVEDKVVRRNSHYGWGTQLADVWFQKGEGVYVIELVMENMDDLGFFCGVVDSGILEEEDWAEDQLRDSTHFHGMHGDGRLFLKSKENT